MNASVQAPRVVASDPKMPFLAAALCAAEATRQLAPACARLTRGGRFQVRAARVIRYKPGRRCVIEYDVEVTAPGAPPETVTVVGKARARGADRTVYALMQALWASGLDGKGRNGVSVPEPIGLVPAFGMWLQRRAPGIALTHLLPGGQGVALARRVAEAAHHVHRLGPPTTRSHSPDEELAILGKWLDELARERPRWARRLTRLFGACCRLACALGPARCGIHRDLHPDQVLADGECLVLLDFDLYCAGDPALDAGNFIAHLTEQSVRTFGAPGLLADREQALEDRFVELSGEACRPAVRAYALLTLARHVGLSTRYPERQPVTERLLELCEERFATASRVRT